ncbi:MAG TPA: PfkB family carbohydrate kinase [Terracidiphilus sp.]|nr:PfkB family carbohydrate kinase [Terracidiphilus sp.]
MVSGVFVGLSTVDIIYALDEHPAANAKLVARTQQTFAGGPATNAAVTFSYLGGRATLIAPVGRHALTNLLKEELTRCSVELIDLTPESSEPPPISSIYVDRHGRRSVVSVNTTCTQIPPPQIDHFKLKGAQVILIDGHAMEACKAWSAAARGQGVSVVFDGGSWKPGTNQLLKNVDIAICSADFRPPGCTNNSDAVIEYLRTCGVRSVAISAGADAVRYDSGSSAGSIEVPPVEAVDTTGAGDIFHGAFCYYAAAGLGFVNALREAAAIASESCRFHGTREWMRGRSSAAWQRGV